MYDKVVPINKILIMEVDIMWENCVLVPAAWLQLRERNPHDNPCEHCFWHKYGCPEKEAFTVGYHKYIPTEESSEELPKCGIWCRECKDTSGKVVHKTIWNCKPAYAVKCSHCGSTFMLYAHKVRAEYTGFKNLKGDYVPPQRYGTTNWPKWPATNRIPEYSQQEREVLTVEGEKSKTAMQIAMEKAGLI